MISSWWQRAVARVVFSNPPAPTSAVVLATGHRLLLVAAEQQVLQPAELSRPRDEVPGRVGAMNGTRGASHPLHICARKLSHSFSRSKKSALLIHFGRSENCKSEVDGIDRIRDLLPPTDAAFEQNAVLLDVNVRRFPPELFAQSFGEELAVFAGVREKHSPFCRPKHQRWPTLIVAGHLADEPSSNREGFQVHTGCRFCYAVPGLSSTLFVIPIIEIDIPPSAIRSARKARPKELAIGERLLMVLHLQCSSARQMRSVRPDGKTSSFLTHS
jgi:hypothetical protein